MANAFSKHAMKALLPITMLLGGSAFGQQSPQEECTKIREPDSCTVPSPLPLKKDKASQAAKAAKAKEEEEDDSGYTDEFDGEITDIACLSLIAQKNRLFSSAEETNRTGSYAFGAIWNYTMWRPKGIMGAHLFIKALAFTGDKIGREDASRYDIYGDPRWKNLHDKVLTTKAYATVGGGLDACFLRNKRKEPLLEMSGSIGFGAAINDVRGNHTEPLTTKARFVVELYGSVSAQITKRIGVQAGVVALNSEENCMMANVGLRVNLVHLKF